MTGVEVLGWYDGIAYRLDEKGNRISRLAKIHIEEDELCRYGKIYKIEQVGEYEYKIISSREDILITNY